MRRTVELGAGRSLTTQSAKRWLIITDDGDSPTLTARRDERARALAAWREAVRAQPSARVVLVDTSSGAIDRDTSSEANDPTPEGATSQPHVVSVTGPTPVEIELAHVARFIAEAKALGADVSIMITLTP